ncbi:MAG: hypothetical protein HYZ75_03900 [Elusimicrobia bacterium]|nr:hypothetical protein [Elusimicrobiota bacterium]
MRMKKLTQPAVRAYVWARRGRTAYLVEARLAERAVAALPERAGRRLLERLRANARARM